VLFVANGTLELGPPLLAFAWVFYGLLGAFDVPDAFAGGRAARHAASGAPPPPDHRWRRLWQRMRWVAAISGVYVALQARWWTVVRVAALGHVSTYNEGLPLLLQAAGAQWPSLVEVKGALRVSLAGVTGALTAPVALFALLGVPFLSRRTAAWSIAWVALVLCVGIATRNLTRVQYLAFPGAYVPAAAAAAGIGNLLARAVPRSPHPLARLLRSGATWAPSALLVAVVARAVLGDLAGDLSLVRYWWPPS
jgi:hypothetical protein